MTRHMAGLPEPLSRPAAFVDRPEATAAISAWEARVCNPSYRLSDGARDRPTLAPIHSSKLPAYLGPMTYYGRVYLGAAEAHKQERA